MDKLNMKVKGIPHVYNFGDNEEVWQVCFQTKIFPFESDDMVQSLNDMGILVKASDKRMLTILIPHGWYHIEVSKEVEAIYDNKGNQRIYINRKEKYSMLLCRFDIGIEMGMNDESGAFNGIIGITDKGSVVWSQEFTQDDFEGEELPTDFDSLIEHFMSDIANIIKENYPDWRQPHLYWDEE